MMVITFMMMVLMMITMIMLNQTTNYDKIWTEHTMFHGDDDDDDDDCNDDSPAGSWNIVDTSIFFVLQIKQC